MKRALQLLGGTLLGLVLAEGLFRYADDGAFAHVNFYVPDATLGVRLAPGATERIAFGGNPVTTVRVNAEGYRGADWGPPTDGEIVVIGDSQVFGLGVDEDQTASAVLAATLGRPVRNAGVPTYGPTEYLAVLEETLAARHPSAVVLVLNFSNDPFEVNTPNTERHAVWDGWAVRKETAPDAVFEFPGRRWLMSRSHLVLAVRRAWWTPPEAWGRGVASEGTWAQVVGAATARPEPPPPISDAAVRTEVEEAVGRRVEVERDLGWLYGQLFPELHGPEGDLVLEAVRTHAHAGDIVSERAYAESSRAIEVTAEQLRTGARLRRELEGRLTAWLAEHPDHRHAEGVREALATRARLDAQLGTLATRVAADVGGRSPLDPLVLAARDRCRAAGAELLVVALPLDVQVSSAEWAKYGNVAPLDMTHTRVLLTDLVQNAERLGVRALDATDALAAAEPGAFLDADLHMSPKGQAALAAAVAARLEAPAPVVVPGGGLPDGRTRVPTWEELTFANEIVVTGSTRNRCSTRRLREWMVVDCTPPRDGAWEAVGVRVVEGEEALVGGGTRSVLVTPLVPGRPVVADFTWTNRTERLTVAWEGDTPKMAFSPTARPLARAASGCVAELLDWRKDRWFGDPSRGCEASFPDDCDAQLACAAGTRAPLPTCADGAVNAGSAGHCHASCEATPCATGTCADWMGARVCL